MSITEKTHKSQFIIFSLCLIIFCVAAAFGWNKLHYGFNFIDEGYHATESWRLAAGDDFLTDKITGALMHYTLINRIFFKIYPDISLLQLRQLQFILTIASLLIFSIALFRQSQEYAWLPFAFSLFAFTGLDPVGMISNLYYQTYPHLFLVLYLSFMLFGFRSENLTIKKISYLLSGLCLWAINLSLLYTGLIILSPVIVFILSRKLKLKDYPFTFEDLLYVLSPFVVCWILFITVFNKAYLLNLFNSLDVILSMSAYSDGLINVNWEVVKHITISMVFLSLFFVSIKKMPVQFFIPECAILSLIILLIINTSLFGFLKPYYNGWLSKPMWFSSLLMAFTIFFWMNTIRKYVLKRAFGKEEELSIILMVPFTICACTMSIFSGLGSLSVSQTAIPAVAAIAYMSTSQLKNTKYQQPVAIVILILLLGPFYYSTARSDWEFTFFDVQPKQATVRIETGFGRGIYTNPLYSKLYDWLIANAAAFAQPDDYAISYIVSPMVHMITKLRPSLDDTFITFEKPRNYFEKCIEKMEQRGREPKIAFIFERMPILIPVSVEKGTVTFPGKAFDFQSSDDPISTYVKTHMTPASTFKISDDHIIRCYVDNNLPKNQKTGTNP
ncbi:MAG: hypothetical protein WA081_18305 [Desulfosalsimonadaceae bacterium]